MRMYLISDNTDTLTGMRLAGVDGVIANEKGTLEKALNEVLKTKISGSSCSLKRSERSIRSWLRRYAQNIKSRFSSKSRTATEQDGGPISSRHM